MAPAASEALAPTVQDPAAASSAMMTAADGVLNITYPMDAGSISLPVFAGATVRVRLCEALHYFSQLPNCQV